VNKPTVIELSDFATCLRRWNVQAMFCKWLINKILFGKDSECVTPVDCLKLLMYVLHILNQNIGGYRMKNRYFNVVELLLIVVMAVIMAGGIFAYHHPELGAKCLGAAGTIW